MFVYVNDKFYRKQMLLLILSCSITDTNLLIIWCCVPRLRQFSTTKNQPTSRNSQLVPVGDEECGRANDFFELEDGCSVSAAKDSRGSDGFTAAEVLDRPTSFMDWKCEPLPLPGEINDAV